MKYNRANDFIPIPMYKISMFEQKVSEHLPEIVDNPSTKEYYSGDGKEINGRWVPVDIV